MGWLMSLSKGFVRFFESAKTKNYLAKASILYFPPFLPPFFQPQKGGRCPPFEEKGGHCPLFDTEMYRPSFPLYGIGKPEKYRPNTDRKYRIDTTLVIEAEGIM